VVLALLVMLLVVTGIPLNHSSEWQLDQRTVRAPWLLTRYGIQADAAHGYQLESGHWMIQSGQHLFLDDVDVARCSTPLSGAVASGQMLVAVCAEELVLLTHGGELIEQIGSAYDLPLPLTGVALAAGKVWLQNESRWYQLDLDLLTWTAASELLGSLQAVGPSTVPLPLQDAVKATMLGESITIERVLQDLHSGRLFGAAGVWLVDLTGVLLLIIALSGCYVWLSKPGRFRRHRQSPPAPPEPRTNRAQCRQRRQ
jgi:uncharacterized iron-regulated membrane protein